jgi:hypothetical protein
VSKYVLSLKKRVDGFLSRLFLDFNAQQFVRTLKNKVDPGLIIRIVTVVEKL